MQKTRQWKWFLPLIFIALVFALAGVFLLPSVLPDFPYTLFLLQLLSILFINSMVLWIVLWSVAQEGKTSVLLALGAMGFKFVAYLFVLLAFYLSLKNLSRPFILTFFVLYLPFTLITLVQVFKVLTVSEIKK